MAEIIWTEPALNELNDIAEYIALDNLAAARNLIEKVFKSTERLKTFQKSGRIPPELSNSVYREIIVTPCRIFYREDLDRVLIILVMREERQLRTYMLNASEASA